MILLAQLPVLASGHYPPGLVAELQSTFQSIPIVGQVCVYGMLVLSAISCAIIISKFLLLYKIRKADQIFKNRLRQSESCLEVYEKNESFAPSHLFEIYDSGSRAVAREMVGLEDSRYLLENNLLAGGRLNLQQLAAVDTALAEGACYCSGQLRNGFKTLIIITLAAPALAVIGGGWILLEGTFSESGSFRGGLGSGLFIAWISFAVAGGAGFFRGQLLNRCRSQVNRNRRFQERMSQVFEKIFKTPFELDSDLMV